MNILKEEITARESCDFLKSQMRHEVLEFQERAGQERHFTTEALYMGAKVLNCAFCRKNHFHNKCNVATGVAERKQIVWKKRLCYRCLPGSHVARNCRSKRSCYRCKSSNHHTAICLNEWRNNENAVQKSQQTMVNSRTPVLLQTVVQFRTQPKNTVIPSKFFMIRVLSERIYRKGL